MSTHDPYERIQEIVDRNRRNEMIIETAIISICLILLAGAASFWIVGLIRNLGEMSQSHFSQMRVF